MKKRKRIFAVVMCFALWHMPAPVCAQAGTDTQKLKDMEKKAETAVENIQAQNVEIIATDFKFTPSEFTVPAGRKVRVTLINKARKPHNIQFVINGKEIRLDKDLGPGESGSLEFAVEGPGVHSFKCPVDLHSVMGMKGRMIVK